jgi:hypothetical protein
MLEKFWLDVLMEQNNFEERHVVWKLGLTTYMDIRKIGCGEVSWIKLTPGKFQIKV